MIHVYMYSKAWQEKLLFYPSKGNKKPREETLSKKASQKCYIYLMNKYVHYANTVSFPKEYIRTWLALEQKMWVEHQSRII